MNEYNKYKKIILTLKKKMNKKKIKFRENINKTNKLI